MAYSKLFCLIVSIASLNFADSLLADDHLAQTPTLPWEERSDWLNVKTVGGAKGDGVADDTDAIQSTLNRMDNGSTIYFPPGTYRITKTLLNPKGRFPGVSLLGHGRETTIAWDGEPGGRMFTTADGMLVCRYVGLTWDGRGKAAVGFDHASQHLFETEMRHQHEAYRNFTEAGIRVGHEIKTATAETLYDNCVFENCKNGVLLLSFNVLDHTFDGCEFRNCGVGINGGKGTNFYARDSHFEQSGEVDIICRGEQGSSIRRCTSHGSNRFVSFGSSVGPLTIQDCQVAAWKDATGAIQLNGAPVLMFDCAFTNPPGACASGSDRGGGATIDRVELQSRRLVLAGKIAGWGKSCRSAGGRYGWSDQIRGTNVSEKRREDPWQGLRR